MAYILAASKIGDKYSTDKDTKHINLYKLRQHNLLVGPREVNFSISPIYISPRHPPMLQMGFMRPDIGILPFMW